MQIYIRLNKIAERISGSQTKMAKDLGVPQGTFNGYLNEEGQTKIRVTLMEKILETYPQIRRDWLYFGEGDMLKTEQHTALTPPEPELDMQQLLARLEAIEKKVGVRGDNAGEDPYVGTQGGNAAYGVRQDGN